MCQSRRWHGETSPMPVGDMFASCFTQPSPAEKSYAGKRDQMRTMLLAIAFALVWVSLGATRHEGPDGGGTSVCRLFQQR